MGKLEAMFKSISKLRPYVGILWKMYVWKLKQTTLLKTCFLNFYSNTKKIKQHISLKLKKKTNYVWKCKFLKCSSFC